MGDTQKHTKPNVPNLRFPGFEGEWEKVTIGQICNIVGGGTPDTNTKEYWNGGIQWFTPSEVGKEKYVSDSNRTVSVEGLKSSSAKLLPPYSILLSSRATVGECSINLKECCTNQGFQSAVPNMDITATEFLYYRLLTHKREFIKKACGSTFLEISAKQISKHNTFIPARAEQEKIADLLSMIDQRIAIQNKIIERYQSLIRAITKDLVITDGKPVKLGDIAEIYQPRTISVRQMTSKGKYPVYGANGIIGHYSDYNHATEQICIACRGNTCGVVNYSKPFSWITGNSMVINVDQSAKAKLINKRYLFHLLSTVDYTPLVSGSGQPQIVRGPLRKMNVVLPCIEKQILVAQLLDAMAERHEMEKEIMSRWVAQKQALLNQLFI